LFEAVFVKLLGYFVFWSSDSRQQFRGRALRSIRAFTDFVYCSTLRALPRSRGERLIERRVSIFGIPVLVRRWARPKYRVALLVDEFFGGWETAIGGYGALARKYICRYVPNEEIQIDLLLCVNNGNEVEQKLVDETMIYRLPLSIVERQKWLDAQVYNLFVSIEMTAVSFWIIKTYDSRTPLLYMIQDPRDLKLYQPRLQTVTRLRDDDWSYIKDVSEWVQGALRQRRISFVSQGQSLTDIARKMYELPATPPIPVLPNPVEIEFEYALNDPPKENKIIFLGRLEAQKRAWVVCEIAKAMPQYEFYILGATGKGRNESANASTLEQYRNPDGSSKIANLHFTGHLDGAAKSNHIKTAKLLLNTSIWEGIPVSWLEALSYGTLIVSAFDRDCIVERFGTFVGEIMGDGVDAESIGRFTRAIDYWMTHDAQFDVAAQLAIDYIRNRHSIAAFTDQMRTEILAGIK
jgi:glycosyltransferase involved in cell wall biosynthesis